MDNTVNELNNFQLKIFILLIYLDNMIAFY